MTSPLRLVPPIDNDLCYACLDGVAELVEGLCPACVSPAIDAKITEEEKRLAKEAMAEMRGMGMDPTLIVLGLGLEFSAENDDKFEADIRDITGLEVKAARVRQWIRRLLTN